MLSDWRPRAGIFSGPSQAAADSTPSPLLAAGQPVDWWLVLKFNVASFPGCGENAQRDFPFGAAPRRATSANSSCMQAVRARRFESARAALARRWLDPLRATFDEVYSESRPCLVLGRFRTSSVRRSFESTQRVHHPGPTQAGRRATCSPPRCEPRPTAVGALDAVQVDPIVDRSIPMSRVRGT